MKDLKTITATPSGIRSVYNFLRTEDPDFYQWCTLEDAQAATICEIEKALPNLTERQRQRIDKVIEGLHRRTVK